MRLTFFLGICCVFAVLNCCECLKRCWTDEYYVERQNGKVKCSPCPECFGGGMGYDTSVVREEDEHGFKTCYPCQKCAQGTYRPLNGHSYYCYKCVLDCARANRYESVRCGGDTEGHCGDCITGYRPESSEPNSMCYPFKEAEQPAVVRPVSVTTLKEDIKTESDGTNIGINEDQMKPKADSVREGSEEQYYIMKVILIGVFSVLGLCGIGIASCRLKRYCQRSSNLTGHDVSTLINSEARLLNDSGSSILTGFGVDVRKEKWQRSEQPTTISITDEKDLPRSVIVYTCTHSVDEGLEVGKPLLESACLPNDGLEVDCLGDSIVRGELPSHESITEGIGLPPVQDGTITQEGLAPVQEEIATRVKTAKSNTHCYYNRPVHEDDETMTVAANGIHGERRHELFKTHLKLSDSKVGEFDEKWIRDTDNYPLQQNMLDCLKLWLRKYAKEADLKLLLESLKKAGFEDVANEIVKLPENQTPVNYPENDENVMYIDLMN